MSAQTKVEVTRGVFDPRTYKQVKVVRSLDQNFSGQEGNNLFLIGNCVKSLPSCSQLMWWSKSGTIPEFEIFSIPIAGGQAELGKEEEARVDGEHYYIICISYFNFRYLSIYCK